MSTAMKQCPECYSQIDVRARTCPNCRKRLPVGASWHIGSIIMALGLLTLIAGLCLEPITGLIIGGVLLLIGYFVRG